MNQIKTDMTEFDVIRLSEQQRKLSEAVTILYLNKLLVGQDLLDKLAECEKELKQAEEALNSADME